MDNVHYGTTTTTYNAAGLATKEVIDLGAFKTIALYTYNAKGALSTLKMEIVGSYAKRNISYSKYKYDAKGNWIYRVKTQDGDVIAIEERKITS